MLGLMLNGKEAQEMEYLLRGELEELLLDLDDPRMEKLVRWSMEERYNILFRIYSRFAPPGEVAKYVRQSKQG